MRSEANSGNGNTREILDRHDIFTLIGWGSRGAMKKEKSETSL